MMNEKRKKTITITIVGIIFLLVILITATYAYFSAKSTAEKQQVTTAKEELIVTPTSDPIHISNIKPTSDFLVSGDSETEYYPTDVNKKNKDVVTIPISVESKSTIDINYNLTIKPENLNFNTGNDADNKELIGGTTEDIKWVLYDLDKLDKATGSYVPPDSYGDFYNTTKEQNILTEVSISPNDIHKYILFIYIEETETSQNKLQNISFDVVIGANTKPIDIVDRKLSEVVLENNIIKDREPNFKPIKYVIPGGFYRTGLSDKGLFKIKDRNIYYFRGNLPTDEVLFSRFKENDNIFNDSTKDIVIRWKILRINADNSITLIYKGAYNSDSYDFNNPSGKTDYEGSNIQEELEKWYENTFTEKEKEMIQKTTFCNDRSNNYQGVSDRLNNDNSKPTLDCPEGDKIEANIGLPTADEMFFAGLTNDNNRDINCGPYGCSFSNIFRPLTMFPASENSLYNCNSYYCGTFTSGEIYPVITLKPDVTISANRINLGKTYKSKIGEYNIGFDE